MSFLLDLFRPVNVQTTVSSSSSIPTTTGNDDTTKVVIPPHDISPTSSSSSSWYERMPDFMMMNRKHVGMVGIGAVAAATMYSLPTHMSSSFTPNLRDADSINPVTDAELVRALLVLQKFRDKCAETLANRQKRLEDAQQSVKYCQESISALESQGMRDTQVIRIHQATMHGSQHDIADCTRRIADCEYIMKEYANLIDNADRLVFLSKSLVDGVKPLSNMGDAKIASEYIAEVRNSFGKIMIRASPKEVRSITISNKDLTDILGTYVYYIMNYSERFRAENDDENCDEDNDDDD